MINMKNQNEHKEPKSTITMTVEIPKSSRDKLARLKGIYGCNTLGGAVSSTIEDVVIPDLLRLVADREGSPQNDTLSTHDQSADKSIDIIGSLYGEEEIAMIAFCNELKVKLGYDTIVQIDAFIEAGKIEIVDLDKPIISPAGEMPDDIPE